MEDDSETGASVGKPRGSNAPSGDVCPELAADSPNTALPPVTSLIDLTHCGSLQAVTTLPGGEWGSVGDERAPGSLVGAVDRPPLHSQRPTAPVAKSAAGDPPTDAPACSSASSMLVLLTVLGTRTRGARQAVAKFTDLLDNWKWRNKVYKDVQYTGKLVLWLMTRQQWIQRFPEFSKRLKTMTKVFSLMRRFQVGLQWMEDLVDLQESLARRDWAAVGLHFTSFVTDLLDDVVTLCKAKILDGDVRAVCCRFTAAHRSRPRVRAASAGLGGARRGGVLGDFVLLRHLAVRPQVPQLCGRGTRCDHPAPGAPGYGSGDIVGGGGRCGRHGCWGAGC